VDGSNVSAPDFRDTPQDEIVIPDSGVNPTSAPRHRIA
jgi:hypothetical protein